MDLGWLLGIVIGLVAVWAALLLLLWLLRPRDMRLGEALRLVPDLLRLIRSLLADRQAPLGVRVALGFLLAWLLNPIDLIPEFVPVIGPLDDIVVAVLVLRYVRRRLGDGEMRRRWPGTEPRYELLSSILGSP
jgi:uncharacterized membrane protein YkvA (DUF1232 family)